MHLKTAHRNLFLSIHEPEIFLMGAEAWLLSTFPGIQIVVRSLSYPPSKPRYEFQMWDGVDMAYVLIPGDNNRYDLRGSIRDMDAIIRKTLLAKARPQAKAITKGGAYVPRN